MLEYLKDHILEEIEGAIDYMKKALELKGKNPYASKFYRMSEMELEHANCLTKMLSSLNHDDSISDSEYSTTYKSILDAYSTGMAKVEAMKKLYYS